MGIDWCNLGQGYYRLGELEKAREYIVKGLDIQRLVGFSQVLTTQYCGLSMVYIDLGHLENARKYAEDALNLARNNSEKTSEVCGSWGCWAGYCIK